MWGMGQMDMVSGWWTSRGRVCAGVLGCMACMLVALAGCQTRKSRLEGYYKQAATARAATATAMAADWRARKLKLDDCLNLAFERLDADAEGATAFAGAVLDVVQQIERELPQQGEFEIMWIRIGSLAGVGAEKAYTRGDMAEARTIVLAGGQRWQTEAFWRRHINHDALAAYILFNSGEGAEALRRLRSRGDLDGPTQQAYDDISRAMTRR
jgi:hypothetical protein